MKTMERTAPAEVDGPALARDQSAQLIQTWTDLMAANYQVSRRLTGQMLEQAYEVQSLWLQLFEAPFRSAGDTLAWARDRQAGE